MRQCKPTRRSRPRHSCADPRAEPLYLGKPGPRKRTLQRKTHFDNVPAKPQRVYEEMNEAFGKDTCYVSTIGLSQINVVGSQSLTVSSFSEAGQTASLRTSVSEECQAAMIDLHGQSAWDEAVAEQAAIDRADQAMYRAKKAGKNRVMMA